MARSTKTLSASFKGFTGINSPQSHSGEATVSDLCNFRVEENGSLTRRCGYGILAPHYSMCENVWGTRLNGSHKYYYCDYPGAYIFDGSQRLLGTLPTKDPAPVFFRYNGHVYLNACQKTFRAEDGLKEVVGYVPLMGKDWPTTRPGKIYEPLNFLNRYARITYVVPETYTPMLPTMYPLKQVITLYRDGTLLTTEDYKFNPLFNTIDILAGVHPGDTFSAVVEFDCPTSEHSGAFFSAKDAATFGDVSDNRVFFWGGSDANRFFVNRHVSRESIAEAQAIIPKSEELYFSETDTFTVGDGRNPITAINQLNEKVFIFTTDDVWITDAVLPSDGSMPRVVSYSQAGGTTKGGSVSVGNSIICVGRNAVMKWSFDTNEEGRLSAEPISGPISGIPDRSFFESAKACYDPSRDEVWFTVPSNSECDVWVYGVNTGQWSKFKISNILGLFDGDNTVGFYTVSGLRLMSEAEDADVVSSYNTEPIVATMKSGILDFGSSRKKRLTEIEIVGDLGGESVEITVSCDTGETVILDLSSDTEHAVIRQRVRTGRFTTAVLALKTSDRTTQTIHSIKLIAKEK